MIKYIRKLIKSNKKEPESLTKKSAPQDCPKSFTEEELKKMEISASLTQNMNQLKEIMGKNADLITRNITLGRSGSKPAALVYLDNLIDSHHVDPDIMRPLVLDAYTSGLTTGSEIIEQLKAGNLITRGQTKTGKNFNDLLGGVLKGEAGLLVDGVKEAYIISSKGYEYRSIAESDVEPVVRGPREAFIEVLSVNVGLIRRRIHSPNLVFESLELGTVGKVKICMGYIRGICPAGLSDEVRARIEKIRIDTVLETSYIEEFIQDNPYSIFPQMRTTEKPDTVASSLMEGRVAIIVDTTPVVLIVPGEFFSLMQAPEDYYNRYSFSILVRLLRYFAFAIALLLPSSYIAATNYHQEMIPTGLLVSIIAARAAVPFPAVIEAMIMEITFEILREAGVRLPRPIGQAVSIVGALVVGQAAVQANIVSPLMVIVVALTGIATFSIPQFSMSLPVRILRFLLMLLASVLGMFGVMIGILFIMLHLFSLESFGKPYMSPLSPLRTGDLKDTAVRLPWWSFVRRPENSSRNIKRMRSGQAHHFSKKGGR